MQGLTASYVITTLVTAPASATLTTLANVHDDLNIPTTDTSNDAFLTRAITQCSNQISRYCNRIFGLATWQDEFRPQRGVWGEGVRAPNNPLMLTRWPLIGPFPEFTGNTYSSNLVDTLSSTSGLAVGQLISGAGIPSGATIASLNVPGASLTLSVPATATGTAVPMNAGISVVETIDGNITGLAAGTDFEIQTGSTLPGDEGTSMLYRLNQFNHPRTWPAAQIVVVYQAGYGLPNDEAPTMPSDLEDACLRLVTARFKARGRDPLLVERSQQSALGSERYWVGTLPGQVGSLPPEIEAIVRPYRVPVTA